MAKARALDKRRKSVRNIRKITRTMELIARARFKKAMDRAHASTSYTQRITQLVRNLAESGLEVSHPLLEARPETKKSVLLVITSNRGLCGGYNGSIFRNAAVRYHETKAAGVTVSLEVSGKRGVNACKFRKIPVDQSYTHFEDKPTFAEVEVLADRYLADFVAGKIDRLDVAYMKFETLARQHAVVETLLPLASLEGSAEAAAAVKAEPKAGGSTPGKAEVVYEFLPSAQSILEEVVPTSFKVKLFKAFLDAAVSEQIARMVAMKGATDAAGKMIKALSMKYNRARQGAITSEIIEIIGGVEALNG